MAAFHFNKSAPVFGPDGAELGMLQKISGETIVVVMQDGRSVQIPQSLIDVERSTPEQLILAARFEAHQDGVPTTVPVHAEELTVHVTEVDQGKVRIQKSIERVPVQEYVELGMDVVHVERIPTDEEFDEPPQSRQDGDTLVIPVVEEVLVLTRRYRVVEEVRISKRREVRTELVEDELRREVMSFHEEDADGNPVDS